MGARETGPLGELVALVEHFQKAGARTVTVVKTTPDATVTAVFETPRAPEPIVFPEVKRDPEAEKQAVDDLIGWSA